MIIACLIMGMGLYLTLNKVGNLKEDIKRKDYSISQLESDNYSIEFKKGELEKYIADQNTEFKKSIDSVLRANDIEVKRLKKIIRSTSKVTLVDTIYLDPKPVYIEDDTIYHLQFIMDSTCLSVSGRVFTTDSLATVSLDKVECNSEASLIAYWKKKKWWQWCKKKQLMVKMINNCGETTIKELEITK